MNFYLHPCKSSIKGGTDGGINQLGQLDTTMGLTKLQCENAKSDGKDRKLSDGKGLYLQVTANGAKYWRYKYRYLNKQKLLALGVYPEVSLAEAREKHRLAHKQVADGIDPSAFKQAEKKSKLSRANNTFESIGREWYEHKKGIWSENHADTVIRRLEQDVFPIIGKIPITEVSSAMLLNDVIRAIEKRAAHEMATLKKSYWIIQRTLFFLDLLPEQNRMNLNLSIWRA